MLSKQIEKAQRKVEEQNFLIRKRVLEYDDVMNEQRRIVYAYRDEVLEGKDMGEPGARGARQRRRAGSSTSTRPATSSRTGTSTACSSRCATSSRRELYRAARSAERQLDREELIEALDRGGASSSTTPREEELGEELMRALERYLLLQIIDNRWREHLYDMDYLREGIHLRGFAQIEPIVAYKNEAFELFSDLMSSIWSDFARMVFHVEVEVQGEDGAPPPDWTPAAGLADARRDVTYSGGADARPSALSPRRRPARAPRSPASTPTRTPTARRRHRPVVQQRRVDADQAIGRNDPCWCGAGKKFKKCHGA